MNSKKRYYYSLFIGLFFLGFGVFQSWPIQLINKCVVSQNIFPVISSYRFYFWDLFYRYIFAIFAVKNTYGFELGYDPALDPYPPCVNIYGHIFYIDLYLIGLIIVVYGLYGLLKKPKQ